MVTATILIIASIIVAATVMMCYIHNLKTYLASQITPIITDGVKTLNTECDVLNTGAYNLLHRSAEKAFKEAHRLDTLLSDWERGVTSCKVELRENTSIHKDTHEDLKLVCERFSEIVAQLKLPSEFEKWRNEYEKQVNDQMDKLDKYETLDAQIKAMDERERKLHEREIKLENTIQKHEIEYLRKGLGDFKGVLGSLTFNPSMFQAGVGPQPPKIETKEI